MGCEAGPLRQGELEDLAVRLASRMEPGDAVILSGEVGAGKTTFTRAACSALGVENRVTSPTYQLARSYEGSIGGERIVVNHLDLYRIEGMSVEDALDLDEYLTPYAITFIEWAEPALGAIRNPTLITLSHNTEETREIMIEGPLCDRVSAGPFC